MCGYLKVNFSETLSIFGDKRPRNGSKNGEMAPRTGTGYPHIGVCVEAQQVRRGGLWDVMVGRERRGAPKQRTGVLEELTPFETPLLFLLFWLFSRRCAGDAAGGGG